MDFCSAHFGKKLNDLTYQDIESFFNTEKSETDQLEFKSFAGTMNENYNGLIRTMCAFLNSKGGLLIWGAPLGSIPPGKNEKVFVGALTPINQVLPKDPLISKCSDSITPLPGGIRVEIITNSNNGCVCVFEIDESNYSPHQFEKTYLMRLDGQNKPAPHHYVEALFKKTRFPNIEAYITVVENSVVNYQQMPHNRILLRLFFFNWSPLQNEEYLSFRLVLSEGFFPDSRLNPERYRMNGGEYFLRGRDELFHYGEPRTEQCAILVPLASQETTLDLFLTFSGKFSPSKMSSYTLDLSKIPAKVSESIVISRSENELVKDIQDRNGTTRESMLKEILGR